MKDDVDEMFYRDYGETDTDGNHIVSILYVSDGVPVTDLQNPENSQSHFHDDAGIKIPVDVAKKWGLTTD